MRRSRLDDLRVGDRVRAGSVDGVVLHAGSLSEDGFRLVCVCDGLDMSHWVWSNHLELISTRCACHSDVSMVLPFGPLYGKWGLVLKSGVTGYVMLCNGVLSVGLSEFGLSPHYDPYNDPDKLVLRRFPVQVSSMSTFGMLYYLRRIRFAY